MPSAGLRSSKRHEAVTGDRFHECGRGAPADPDERKGDASIAPIAGAR